MNGDAFLTYIAPQLAPCLSAGDIVILDNLSTHKVKGIGEIIQAKGARLLYLPPYSPNGPKMRCATESADCWKPLHRKNAQTTLSMLDMTKLEWNPL